MAELFHVSCISRLIQIKTSAASRCMKAQWPTSFLLLHLFAFTLQQCQKKQAGSGAMDRLTNWVLFPWYLDLASAVEASASESESAMASALEAWARAREACSATSSPNQSRPLAWAAAKTQGPSSSLSPTATRCGSKALVQALRVPPWLQLRG